MLPNEELKKRSPSYEILVCVYMCVDVSFVTPLEKHQKNLSERKFNMSTMAPLKLKFNGITIIKFFLWCKESQPSILLVLHFTKDVSCKDALLHVESPTWHVTSVTTELNTFIAGWAWVDNKLLLCRHQLLWTNQNCYYCNNGPINIIITIILDHPKILLL